MIDLSDCISVSQAATQAAVDRETVYRWIREKKLPADKIGTSWFIRKSDLAAFLAARKEA
jgi:excisionase family DNA binding protein